MEDKDPRPRPTSVVAGFTDSLPYTVPYAYLGALFVDILGVFQMHYAIIGTIYCTQTIKIESHKNGLSADPV